MSPVDPERLERLTDLLRELHGRLTDPDADPDRWELDLYSYDDALVTTADLLDVEVPAAARDEMGPDDRAAIEHGLAAAGLDVWTPQDAAGSSSGN
jgi:hypothetical protein